MLKKDLLAVLDHEPTCEDDVVLHHEGKSYPVNNWYAERNRIMLRAIGLMTDDEKEACDIYYGEEKETWDADAWLYELDHALSDADEDTVEVKLDINDTEYDFTCVHDDKNHIFVITVI